MTDIQEKVFNLIGSDWVEYETAEKAFKETNIIDGKPSVLGFATAFKWLKQQGLIERKTTGKLKSRVVFYVYRKAVYE